MEAAGSNTFAGLLDRWNERGRNAEPATRSRAAPGKSPPRREGVVSFAAAAKARKELAADRAMDVGHFRIARSRFNGALRWAAAREWAGRTGSSDKRVFLALLRIAHTNAKRYRFNASYRRIAEVAGVHVETVCRALKDLEAAGSPVRLLNRGRWVKDLEQGAGSEFEIQRVTVGANVDPGRLSQVQRGLVQLARRQVTPAGEQLDLADDAHRRGGVCPFTLRALDTYGHTAKDIAATVGASVTAVRSRLRKLERVGLAARLRSEPGRAAVWVRGAAEVKDVRPQLRTAGRTAAARACHDRNRRSWIQRQREQQDAFVQEQAAKREAERERQADLALLNDLPANVAAKGIWYGNRRKRRTGKRPKART